METWQSITTLCRFGRSIVIRLRDCIKIGRMIFRKGAVQRCVTFRTVNVSILTVILYMVPHPPFNSIQTRRSNAISTRRLVCGCSIHLTRNRVKIKSKASQTSRWFIEMFLCGVNGIHFIFGATPKLVFWYLMFVMNSYINMSKIAHGFFWLPRFSFYYKLYSKEI